MPLRGPSLPRTLILLTLVSGLLVAEILALRLLWRQDSRKRGILVRTSASLFALAYLLLALEVGFYAFGVQSDSFGLTLASKRWFARHWTPVNAAGFRDDEYVPEALAEKRLVLVVGDSLVAGHGVADYRDRFSNVLERELGPEWRMLNVARNGWHTVDELEAIRSFPCPPEVIVLSYYFNDILHAAHQHGLERPEPFSPPPAWLRRLVERSYVANFAYWRLYRFLSGAEIDRKAWEYHEALVAREDVWETHRAELLEVVRYTDESGIRLVCVVFPNLREIERSKAITSRVVELMERNGVETIDLATILAGRDTAELIVNRLDNHPSVALHREVADLLYERLASPAPTGDG